MRVWQRPASWFCFRGGPRGSGACIGPISAIAISVLAAGAAILHARCGLAVGARALLVLVEHSVKWPCKWHWPGFRLTARDLAV